MEERQSVPNVIRSAGTLQMKNRELSVSGEEKEGEKIVAILFNRIWLFSHESRESALRKTNLQFSFDFFVCILNIEQQKSSTVITVMNRLDSNFLHLTWHLWHSYVID